MTEKKKGKTLKIILTVVVLCGIGAAGFIAYHVLHKDAQPTHAFVRMKPNPDILQFTFAKWLEAYSAMAALDTEMDLIAKEMDRLTQMEEKFPQQRKIILTEKSDWEKTFKTIQSVAEKLEKELEAVYVTYSVNNEKGMRLLQEDTESILKPVDEALSASESMTQRLKTAPDENIFHRIRKMIFGDS